MPATASIIPGFYNLEFGQAFSGANIPTPKPLYLTHNGEGKQLTVEHPTGQINQEWIIQPPLTGEFGDSADFIIIPALSKDIQAVSQDVVRSPDQVSLIKNLQVWSFKVVHESEQVYEIRSNLYAGRVGAVPLLGVDEGFKKAIIQFIPVIVDPPPKPLWQLLPVISKNLKK